MTQTNKNDELVEKVAKCLFNLAYPNIGIAWENEYEHMDKDSFRMKAHSLIRDCFEPLLGEIREHLKRILLVRFLTYLQCEIDYDDVIYHSVEDAIALAVPKPPKEIDWRKRLQEIRELAESLYESFADCTTKKILSKSLKEILALCTFTDTETEPEKPVYPSAKRITIEEAFNNAREFAKKCEEERKEYYTRESEPEKPEPDPLLVEAMKKPGIKEVMKLYNNYRNSHRSIKPEPTKPELCWVIARAVGKQSDEKPPEPDKSEPEPATRPCADCGAPIYESNPFTVCADCWNKIHYEGSDLGKSAREYLKAFKEPEPTKPESDEPITK